MQSVNPVAAQEDEELVLLAERCESVRRRSLVTGLLLALAGCSSSGAGDGVAAESPSPAVPPAPPPPVGRRWYVDAGSGSDAAAGTSAQAPLRSIPALSAGDTVLLRRGTTLVVPGDYTPGVANVSFDAYALPTDSADAPKPIWTLSATANFIVWVGDLEGLSFRNIRFDVPPGQTERPAFRLSVRVPLARAPLFEACDFNGDDGSFFADIRSDCKGLTFRACSFTAARAVSYSYGRSAAVFILATGGTQPFQVIDMLWEGNQMTHAQGMGMQIRSGSATDDDSTHFAGKFVNASFRGNRWHDCATSGVFLRCGFHAEMRIDAAGHYGWDGLLFEDNVIENNGGSGASIGSNVQDSQRTTTIQRNRVLGNGRLNGTTGGLQLMGLRHALVQDNECRDNWTTDTFDGVNLFMDIFDEATSEMQTAGAVGCVVRRNRCSGARGAGGSDYAGWLTAQNGNANSSNAPSSGIRLYFARGNFVYANLLTDNGSGVACDKSADNLIFNNAATTCTLAYYEGVGMGTRGNRFFNNASIGCDWDVYGLGTAGWTLPTPTRADVSLSATQGTWIALSGAGEFSMVRTGVGGRNFFVRESADSQATLGLAVVSMKQSDDEIHVHVLRPFSSQRFAPGALTIGAMEPYLPLGFEHNGRFGARMGSLKEIAAGVGDVLLYPQLDASGSPLASSPWRGAGVPLPEVPLAPVTDLLGRAFRPVPSIGAFEPD